MEPLDLDRVLNSVVGSVFDELEEESEEGHIRNRIRHLEAVTSRARQRERWPPIHSPIQITNFTAEAATADTQVEEAMQNQQIEEGIVVSGKRRSAHLIAKALGVEEPDATGKAEEKTGNFFDCNICLDRARDPVLTCCGHLFCWPCFYQLSYTYSKAKECPVCKGEVNETDIIPVYGNSSATCDRQLELKEAGLTIPPRPVAPRIESTRQKLITQVAASFAQNSRRRNGVSRQEASNEPRRSRRRRLR